MRILDSNHALPVLASSLSFLLSIRCFLDFLLSRLLGRLFRHLLPLLRWLSRQ
jgi:hypothetical protein